MKEEIAAAVVFLSRFLKATTAGNIELGKEKSSEFSSCLSALLLDRFKNHWYEDVPYKGQGYRCIRINSAEPVDPVLERAAIDSGMQYSDLNMPHELTLWVDPDEVCCRFGESEGSLCVLASFKNGDDVEDKVESVDIDEILTNQNDTLNQQVNINTACHKVEELPPVNIQPIATNRRNNHFQHNYNRNQQFEQPPGHSMQGEPKNQYHSKNSEKASTSFSVNANNNRNSNMTKVSPKNGMDRFNWARSSGNKL